MNVCPKPSSDACPSAPSSLDPVSGAVVREIIELAQQALPGGTRSPGASTPWPASRWAGAQGQGQRPSLAAGLEKPEYDVYPADLGTRSAPAAPGGEGSLRPDRDPAREDKPARMRQLGRNVEFFGAPVGLFSSRSTASFGYPQWADVGMYMQTVMLLAVERGLDTIAQEFWARPLQNRGRLPGPARRSPPFSGMALGYRDETAPINNWRTRRDLFEAFAEIARLRELHVGRLRPSPFRRRIRPALGFASAAPDGATAARTWPFRAPG